MSDQSRPNRVMIVDGLQNAILKAFHDSVTTVPLGQIGDMVNKWIGDNVDHMVAPHLWVDLSRNGNTGQLSHHRIRPTSPLSAT